MHLIKKILLSLIEIISILMLVRAVLSWFPNAGRGKLYELIWYMTEPFLLPFRTLFKKLGIGRGLPLDLSFLAAIIALHMLRLLLI